MIPSRVSSNSAVDKTHASSRDARINREMSLIAFNRRVLAMAIEPAVPLLERLRYLCIVGNNLDEFYEIRVAGLRQQIYLKAPLDGMSLPEVRALYTQVTDAARELIDRQYSVLNGEILPLLAERGIRLLNQADRSPAVRDWATEYFQTDVRPLLTPIGLDPSHPWPQIVNKSLNFIVHMSGRNAFGRPASFALIKAPRVLPRVIKIPPAIAGADHQFLLLSSVIHAHLADLFPGREIVAYSQFRLTRNADLAIDEDDVTNLRQALRGELPQRQFGLPLRLEVASSCPDELADFLLGQCGLTDDDLYRCAGPVNIMRLSSMVDEIDIDELKFPSFVPVRSARIPTGADILGCIRAGDILLHHPYQSFDPVVEFIRRAAEDPAVVAIKQTVYRTGVNSLLMEALLDAARRGKEVTVVVELMARFDEEANINWAEQLESAGAHVVYGVFGLKTHAKLALIYRRENGTPAVTKLVPYAHLGTGNYHPHTTKLYTDFGLLTANHEVCADISNIFAHITSLSRAAPLARLLIAPFTMHSRVLQLIRREAQHAREGRSACIRAKMNALLDNATIDALQEASQAGVNIELIVRGACALRPGVTGISDNIKVRSIIGRFLEHHRVWHFDNGGADDVWLSSADWMSRNFFHRIEVAFPVEDPELKARVIDEGIEIYLRDNCNAWNLDSQGEWSKLATDKSPAICAQRVLLEKFRDEGAAAVLNKLQ